MKTYKIPDELLAKKLKWGGKHIKRAWNMDTGFIFMDVSHQTSVTSTLHNVDTLPGTPHIVPYQDIWDTFLHQDILGEKACSNNICNKTARREKTSQADLYTCSGRTHFQMMYSYVGAMYVTT